MSTAIEEIRTRLARYPHADVLYDDFTATFYPSDSSGFIVQFVVKATADLERYLVFYGGCLQQEARRSESILNFGFGLSNGCRLHQFSRSGRVYRWVTEIEGFKGWTPYWETFDFSGPFWQWWRKPDIRCCQNNLIDLNTGGSGASFRARL